MQSMRRTGDVNWQAFVHPDVQPLPQGHLMNYPNSVAADGSVGPLPDCEEFPDLVRCCCCCCCCCLSWVSSSCTCCCC
jgi:hypothetical protein